ncbi:hypothetical protein SAMN06295926_12446 [Lysinibacillus sp. AC-3]|nr:hypothetical protein SAMN06295926_12446 [Lysinibacillus sp. AC-3]
MGASRVTFHTFLYKNGGLLQFVETRRLHSLSFKHRYPLSVRASQHKEPPEYDPAPVAS